MKFFIIHGAYGSSKENWFPWLKEKLEQGGHEVFAPNFPTPERQTLENWMKVFKPYFAKIDSETVFIGHSLGPAFILSVLERIDVRVKACFFVEGFIDLLGLEQFDGINKSFVVKEFDWKKIKKNCRKFVCFQSTNDEYVPIKKGEELAKKLGAELFLVKKAGHFNKKAGYIKFEQLLSEIKART